MQINSLKEAINLIKSNYNDPYALAYIDALPLAIEENGNEGLVSQVRYILCNIQKWKGKEAVAVRKFINKWIDNNKKAEYGQKTK